MPLEFIVFYVFAFIFGSVFGSFACCQAWRIYQNKSSKKLGTRSVCMSCHKKLKWYDNIPVISWLTLRGKCRYCQAKIGKAEIISEILLGLIFLGIAFHFSSSFLYDGGLADFFSAMTTDFLLVERFLILLIAAVIYWVLFVYDAKWGELPVLLMLINVALAIIYQFANSANWLQVGIAVAFLAGIYYILYFFSKERLVGGGDWILCLSIAIFLGNFNLALVELFLANFSASIYAVPLAIRKKTNKISFGPFLIISLFLILLIPLKFSIF